MEAASVSISRWLDKDVVTIFYTFVYHQGASDFTISLISFYLKELINLQNPLLKGFSKVNVCSENFGPGTPGVEWGEDGYQPHQGGKNKARQAPLSMGFSRQEYWSGLPCSPSGDVFNPQFKWWDENRKKWKRNSDSISLRKYWAGLVSYPWSLTGLGPKDGVSWGWGSWDHVAGSVSPKWTWSACCPLESPQPPETGRIN